jgi:dTDP-glucose pyrophosphorylase
MIILIPMGGEGTRFSNAGYKINKACIPTTDRHTGKKLPMIICAMKDIPNIYDSNNKIICVNRDFHEKNGTEDVIRKVFPNTIFIHDHVLMDQAYGCFLAREFLKTDEELFIGACDNGMIFDSEEFNKAKMEADVLMISHSNDDNIQQNPNAHSWAKLKTDGSKDLASISLKKTVSDNPMDDHATTGMFWFKHASSFLKYLEEMIWKKDTLDGKYYVDRVLQYCIDAGLKVQYFDIEYICWGTPYDYENYENTITYWSKFIKKEWTI